ncbi:MAG: hypothetical protein ACRENP_00505 [Longimicrobiales bacterium]
MKLRAFVLLALLGAAAPASAQSLFGMRGLGVAVDPIDPRARALGSIGTGLPGLNTSLTNPADLGGIRRRGVSAMLQPFFGSDELDNRVDDVEGTRFPLIQLLYPIRSRLVLGLGYGGFLEQSWSVVADGEEIIGGDRVATRELVSADGALAQVRLSAAYEVSAALSVGAAFGLYTGNLQRSITRTFPDSALQFAPFARISDWEYGGLLGALGVRLDVSNALRVAGSVTFSGDLDAEPQTDAITSRTYDMPLRFALGAGAMIAPRLMATAGFQYTGWSESEDFATAGTPSDVRIGARPVWEAGGGVEWEQLRSGTRIFPLRVGYRFAQLPFALSGDEPAGEWAVSLGLGLRLASDDFGPLAVGDLAIERGHRSGWDGSISGGLTENFWRFSASVSLFGR